MNRRYMPKTTITPTISLGGARVKPEFMLTKEQFIGFATIMSDNSITKASLRNLVEQLLIQKYSAVWDMLEDLFEGMTDEQIQEAVNNDGWAFGIKG